MMHPPASAGCALCGSGRSEFVLSGPDRLLDLPGEYSFVRCIDCGLVRQDPRPPDALEAHYPESYPSYAGSVEAKGNLLRRLDRGYGQHKRAAIVQRFRGSGRLLDVGCATGDFLLEMRRRHGWDLTGVEPTDYACAYAQGLGLDVVCGTLAQAAFDDASFDVVTMWNVLEHVSDPVAELRETWRVLRPNGILVFSVPVWESRLRRWFGPYWVEWDLPRHMHIFSSWTAQRLLGMTGFQGMGRFTPFSEYRVLHMSSINWAKAHLSRSFLRHGLDRLMRFLPVRAALILLLQAITSRRTASIVVFVGRKE